MYDVHEIKSLIDNFFQKWEWAPLKHRDGLVTAAIDTVGGLVTEVDGLFKGK